MLTRRRFIGLVGIGGLSMLFTGNRALHSNHPIVDALKLKNISARHASIMLSVFSATLAVSDEAILRKAIEKADRLLDHFSTWAKMELIGALEIMEQSPLWSTGSLKKFSQLDQDQQIMVLKNWSTGFKPARPLVLGLKELSVFVYYSQDQSWKEIGYDGPKV